MTRLLAGFFLAVGLGSSAFAQKAEYPVKTITIVVPFPAGGTADLLPRLVAEELRPLLGQPVTILNKPGASGNIGVESVVRAEADGYTLLSAPQLTYSVNHLLNPDLRFDPRTLLPVSVIAAYPTVLFARADLPVNDLVGLIAYAKANPGKLNYASQGRGQIGHLTMEALKGRAGIEMQHVPYRGSAPAITDLVAGHVDLLADNLLSGMQHVESGRLKIIGTGGATRLQAYPKVATFGEILPGFISDTWMAVSAPPNTPQPIVMTLSRAIAQVLQMPHVKKRIEELQAEPVGDRPDKMAALIRESEIRWSPIIKDAQIRGE